MKGSPTAPTGNTITPPLMPSTRNASLKFWANQLHRSTVEEIPDWSTMRSHSCASGSPRPDSRTNRRTPASRAAATNAVISPADCGTIRSGWYVT
jgi:hypothetical protein